MIDVQLGIPPHVAFLLNEEILSIDYATSLRSLRAVLPDLKAQAELSFQKTWKEAPVRSAKAFKVVMSGGLDLFSGSGACSELRCRISYAEQIARSIALMADEVWMHDFFGDKILGLRSRPTNAELMSLLDDVVVLYTLSPLIDAGLLRFSPPIVAACASCSQEFDRRVFDLTSEIVDALGTFVDIDRTYEDKIVLDTRELYDPPLYLYMRPELRNESDREITLRVAGTAIRESLWNARTASMLGGAVFSNSRVGLRGIVREDQRLISNEELRVVEGHRAGNLPWVAGLTVQQTLHLRQEAHSALPRLREFLAKHLASNGDEVQSAHQRDYVSELRIQAEDVRAELEAATMQQRSLAENTLGILSLGICALGLVSETLTLAASASALLGTLGLLHGATTPHKEKVALMKSKPGYVLVAAGEILAHADKA